MPDEYLLDLRSDLGVESLITLLLSWKILVLSQTDIGIYALELLDWIGHYSRHSGYVSLEKRHRVIDLEHDTFLQKPWSDIEYQVLTSSLSKLQHQVFLIDHSTAASLRIICLRRIVMCYHVRSKITMFSHIVTLTLLAITLCLVLVLGTAF